MTDNSPDKKTANQSSQNAGASATNVEILDKLDALPKKDKEQIIATLEMYSGPIPHPAILQGYERLSPGAAKRIIENGVQESEHRRMLETTRQKRRGRMAWFTLISVVVITGLLLIGFYLLIMNDHAIIGSIFGAGGFLTFLGSLVDQISTLSGKDDISTDSTSNDNGDKTE
ncbi:DUF2335 domain-containing protein [Levilactobacillus zymae]|uniref:DUF2335 domain-containing protein n=1 Tax=Levilactobacillus zymae TaxID=267363 RepID=UPI000B3F9318|nr:DUF2335 domain-containing protein [Levilactobacillus zymae]